MTKLSENGGFCSRMIATLPSCNSVHSNPKRQVVFASQSSLKGLTLLMTEAAKFQLKQISKAKSLALGSPLTPRPAEKLSVLLLPNLS